jgi:hypothetical protein
MVRFIPLIGVSIFSLGAWAGTNLPSVIESLHHLDVWPGLPFLERCPHEFHPVLVDAEMLPVDRPSLECVPNGSSQALRKLIVRRSGKLIASLEIELPPQEGSQCSDSLIRSSLGDESLSTKSDFADTRRSQISAKKAVDGELTLTVTCSKAVGLIDAMVAHLSTPYSLLGNGGRALPGRIAHEETVREPYEEPERFREQTRSFGPLAKKLFADNVIWSKDSSRIARRTKFKESEADKPLKAALPQPSAGVATASPVSSAPPVPSTCMGDCMKSQDPPPTSSSCQAMFVENEALRKKSGDQLASKDYLECLKARREQGEGSIRACMEKCRSRAGN